MTERTLPQPPSRLKDLYCTQTPPGAHVGGHPRQIKESPGITTLAGAQAKAAVMVQEESACEMTLPSLVNKYQNEVVKINHKRPFLAESYWRRAVRPTLGRKRVADV